MTYAAGSALRHDAERRAVASLLASRSYDSACVPCREGGCHRRDGDDREAGRVRRPGQRDPAAPTSGGPVPGRHVPAHRPQVVLLGADERRLPHARPGARRPDLLRRAPGARRRHSQPVRPPAAQGQAREPLQRLDRGRARRHVGSRLGEEGRGVRTIIDMVAATRLDCVLGSAATMRAAVTPGGAPRSTPLRVRRLLVDQPLMRNVLADLAVESEAATLLGMRLAHAFDTESRALPASGWPSASSGSASAPRPWWPRRSSASAETAMSRRTGWHGSTARRRSTRSGRARGTSTPST